MPHATRKASLSPAGPAVQSLLIVARDQPELFRVLLQEFQDNPQVFVLLDERSTDRRRETLAVSADRRRQERRSPPRVEENLQRRHYLVVRQTARGPHD